MLHQTREMNKMEKAEIRCDCDGVMEEKTVEHDVGPLFGLDSVIVPNLPVLVCPRCGAVMPDGSAIEHLRDTLASHVLMSPILDPTEVRFLRKLVGDTQAGLAEKLGVDRVTINRWENSREPIVGAQSYALRSHIWFRLKETSSAVAAIAFVFGSRAVPRKKGPYRLNSSLTNQP